MWQLRVFLFWFGMVTGSLIVWLVTGESGKVGEYLIGFLGGWTCGLIGIASWAWSQGRFDDFLRGKI
jgi:hypothetical protein